MKADPLGSGSECRSLLAGDLRTVGASSLARIEIASKLAPTSNHRLQAGAYISSHFAGARLHLSPDRQERLEVVLTVAAVDHEIELADLQQLTLRRLHAMALLADLSFCVENGE